MKKSTILEYMSLALEQAKKAYNANEVPVGAIIIKNNTVIGTGFNQVISNQSVVAHAEIQAINSASKFLKNYRLIGCHLFVTLEPCHMCAKAIIDARLNSIYFGAIEPKTGAVSSIDRFLDKPYLNHRIEYSGGYLEKESSTLMKAFFKEKR